MFLYLLKTLFFGLVLATVRQFDQIFVFFGNFGKVAAVDEDSLFFALHVQSWQICCKKVTFACF